MATAAGDGGVDFVPERARRRRAGNLYLSSLNGPLRRVDAATGIITTIAPQAVALTTDSAGNLYFSRHELAFGGVVHRRDAVTGQVTTVAGGNGIGNGSGNGDGGLAVNALLNYPTGIAVDRSGNLYISEMTGLIRRVDAVSQLISTYAGTTAAAAELCDGRAATAVQFRSPSGLAIDGAGNLLIANFNQTSSTVCRVDVTTGAAVLVGGSSLFASPSTFR